MGCSLICAVGLRCSRPTHTDTAAPEQAPHTGCAQLRGWNEALTKAGLGVQIPPGRSICHSSLVCVETRGRHTEIDTGVPLTACSTAFSNTPVLFCFCHALHHEWRFIRFPCQERRRRGPHLWRNYHSVLLKSRTTKPVTFSIPFVSLKDSFLKMCKIWMEFGGNLGQLYFSQFHIIHLYSYEHWTKSPVVTATVIVSHCLMRF